jgi:hypothetical protein
LATAADNRGAPEPAPTGRQVTRTHTVWWQTGTNVDLDDTSDTLPDLFVVKGVLVAQNAASFAILPPGEASSPAACAALHQSAWVTELRRPAVAAGVRHCLRTTAKELAVVRVTSTNPAVPTPEDGPIVIGAEVNIWR